MPFPLAHHAMTWTGWWRKHDQPFDLDLLLDEVKQAGYEGVEVGGGEGTLGAPRTFTNKLADRGLRVPAFAAAVTANPHPPNTDEYRRAMDYAAAIDVRVITVCGGFLGAKRRNTFDDDYKLFAENLAAAREYAAQLGQRLAFHPHVGCIVETIEETERLLRYLPELDLCVDSGHLIAVRSDPVALVRRYPRQIAHVHLKDWDDRASTFMEIGHGNAGLDFPALFQALEQAGYDGWVCVERDSTPIPPLESARMSLAGLEGLGLTPAPG